MGQHQELELAGEWAGLKQALALALRHPVLMVCGTLLCALSGLLLAMSGTPVFRSSLTIGLDDDREESSTLEQLERPTGELKPERVIPRLRSTAVLSQVVSAPSDGAVPHPDHPEYPARLGLETWVQDETGSALRARLQQLLHGRSSGFRLFASVDERVPGAPRVLRLRLDGAHHVVVSIPKEHMPLELGAASPERLPYVPGEPLQYRGVTLRIAIQGTPDNRWWQIEHLGQERAIERLRGMLQTIELPNQEGVIQVAVEDNDPWRASEIAGSIARAYIDHDLDLVRSRAEDNVTYVGLQLEERLAELEEARRDIAVIEARNTDLLAPTESAISLNQAKNALSQRLMENTQLAQGLKSMLASLREGDRAEASRIGGNLDDARTRKLLDLIADFEARRLNVGELEATQIAEAVFLKLEEARRTASQAGRDLAGFEANLQLFEEGDDSVLSLLTPRVAGLGQYVQQLVADYRAASTQLQGLREVWTDEWEEVRQAASKLKLLRLSLEEQLRGELARLQTAKSDADSWVTFFQTMRSGRPEELRDAADEALEDLWSRVQDAIASRLAGLEEESGSLLVAIGGFQDRLRRMPEDERAIGEPRQRRAALEQAVGTLMTLHESAEVAAAGAVPSAHLLNTPPIAGPRVRPRPSFGLILGMLLGLLVSFGCSMVREQVAGRPRNAAELQLGTGRPVLAAIPTRKERKLRKRVHFNALLEEPAGGEANELRALRARLNQQSDEGGRLTPLGILGASRGDGTTTIAHGLSLAWAFEGRRVLLIEADLEQPDLAERLSLRSSAGLAACLDGRRHWRQCVVPGDHEHLDVLPAGYSVMSSADLLANPVMANLLQEVGERYDQVVIDLPPADGSPEALGLTYRLGSVLLTYGDDGPQALELNRVIARLEQSGAPLLGLVRTGATRRSGARGHAWARAPLRVSA